MNALIAVWTLIAVLAAAGTAWTVWLVRSGGRSWHPGDPLPHVPADAPIRTWHAAAQSARAADTAATANYYGPSHRSPWRTAAGREPQRAGR